MCSLLRPLLRCCPACSSYGLILISRVYRALLGQYTAARVTVAGLRRAVHRGPCTSSRFDTPLLLYLYTFYTAPHVPTRWLVPARVRAPHGIAQQNGEYKYGKALAPGPPRL